MNVRSKKGDISWFMISLITVVFGLAVIILIIVRFNFNADIDRTACSESALVRASITDKLDAKDLVSLTCKTKRVCVTSKSIGSGDCASGLGSKFVTMRITGDEENKKNQIKMILAREMADCWDMLGQGNLKIFNREITPNKINGKAVICSRVMFDDTIIVGDEAITEISGMSLYLLTHKVPNNDLSYWDYLRNANDGDTLQMLSGNAVVGSQIDDKMLLTNQKAIFYLESSVSQIGGVVGAAAGVAGTSLLMGAFGGAGFKGASILGKLAGTTGSAVSFFTVSAIGSVTYGWGDKFFRGLVAPGLDENAAVSGVFLTDYSSEGFQSFEEQHISFENIP